MDNVYNFESYISNGVMINKPIIVGELKYIESEYEATDFIDIYNNTEKEKVKIHNEPIIENKVFEKTNIAEVQIINNEIKIIIYNV